MSIELTPLSDSSADRTALLRITGILSLKDAAELKSSLKRLLREGCSHLLIDLDEMRDMDEAGWAVLISVVRKLRHQNGHAVIRACSDDLYERLRARHWDRDFLFPLRRAEHRASLPMPLQGLFTPPTLCPA